MTDVAARVRTLCLALPEVEEKVSHGAPAFFAKKQFAQVWAHGHHDNRFPHLWCAAPPGAQAELIASSDRFFRPPYVGHRGWIGMRLDGTVDWEEVAEVLEDGYRTVAPARLVALLDA
ncbi:MAG TPA: MmcQ/YjbR family DNA-binding protein [Gaiellaceae bacterium]|nr:MmcQ/YjbR family DNA-binding protein [Gaiellaceae bacterium]